MFMLVRIFIKIKKTVLFLVETVNGWLNKFKIM